MIKRIWLRLLTDLWATKAPVPPDWYKGEIGPKPEYPDGALDALADASYAVDTIGAWGLEKNVMTDAQLAACGQRDAAQKVITDVDALRDEW